MILRRVTEHVKAQNWFAVLIDFVIVVVGVFIGIQVANWNEARVERDRERAALSNLLTQTEANVAYARLIIYRNQKLQRDREAAWARLQGNVPREGDANAGLATLSLIRDFTPRYNFYDELMSSGDIALIGSEKLRQAQSLILGQNRFNDRWREEALDRMPDVLGLANEHVELGLGGPESQAKVVAVNWVAASSNVELRNAATRAMAAQYWWVDRLEFYRDEIEDFCEQLSEAVGRPCAPPDWVADEKGTDS